MPVTGWGLPVGAFFYPGDTFETFIQATETPNLNLPQKAGEWLSDA